MFNEGQKITAEEIDEKYANTWTVPEALRLMKCPHCN